MINMSIEFAHKMSLAYSATCKTLCRELNCHRLRLIY